MLKMPPATRDAEGKYIAGLGRKIAVYEEKIYKKCSTKLSPIFIPWFGSDTFAAA